MSNDQVKDLKKYLDDRFLQLDDRFLQTEDNLRLFIDTRISQSETGLRNEMNNMAKRLEDKMDSGFAGVGEAFELVHDKFEQIDKDLNRL